MMRKIAMFLEPDSELMRHLEGDPSGGILFNDGTMLVDSHWQDCCENVYAGWHSLKSECGIMNTDFSDLEIERVESRNGKANGVRICGKGRKFFLPCYNEQNGYYNDQLDIVLVDTYQTVRRESGFIYKHGKMTKQYTDYCIPIKTWEHVPVTDDIC